MDTRSLTLTELVEQCAEEKQCFVRGQSHDDQACVEIFRRALVEGDETAWQIIQTDYQPLVQVWLRRHPLASSIDDDDDDRQVIAEQALAQFRQAGGAARFSTLASLGDLVRTLKLSVFAALIQAMRARQVDGDERGSPATPQHDPATSWQVIEEVVPDAIDRLALYLASVIALKPVEIARRNPHLFATNAAVYRHLRHSFERLKDEGGYGALGLTMSRSAAGAESDCIQPGEIGDDDLIGYAYGERPRRVRDHVAACPRCAALAARYGMPRRHLEQRFFRFDCLSPFELGEYSLRALPAAALERIGAHLSHCPHCAAEVASAAGFLDTADPEALTAIRGARRQVEARLVPAAPARPGGRRPITLSYVADDLILTLHPQPADKPRDQVQLLGFVEQKGANLAGFAGVRVRLFRDDQTVGTATIDEIGSFIIGPLPQDVYDMELISGTLHVLIRSLPLITSR